MSSLTFSPPQVTALAKDFVLRQAGTLGRQVDERSAGGRPVSERSRLPALREVLATRISGHAGRAARHLLVDMNHAADCWQAALDAGADYRETAAASQLSAASSLGLGWPLDDRLAATAERSEDHLALLEGPMPPASARRLVGVDWSEPFGRAARRAEALWPQARYALSRAIVEQFQGRSLRTIANAAFMPESAEALGRFVQRERHLLAVSGLPQTQQLESLCMAGDLVFGLGRCIRLGRHFLAAGAKATPASRSTGGAPAAALIDHLTRALHDLADLLNDDTLDLFAADSDTAVPPTLGCQTCPPSPVTVVLVEFTDQFDATEVFSGERPQFANLSARALMDHDRAITSRNQLRRSPPFVIRVSPPQAAAVRVRLVREEAPHEFPGPSRNLSARERALSHLQYARSARTMHTNAEGELLVQPGLPISAQAGYRYHVEAAVAGGDAIRSSNSVAIRRRIYMLPVVLYRPGRGAAVAAMARIRRHLRTLGIDVVVLPAQTGTARGVTSEPTFAAYSTIGTNALERPASISTKRPHCIAVVVGEFTGTTGVIEEIDFERVMRRGADGQFDSMPEIQLRHGGDTYNVVPLTDRSQLIRATAKFAGEAPRAIPPEDVLAIDNFGSNIALDLRTVPLAASTADSMTVRVRLKVTRFWYVGWAFSGAPVIYLNMRDPDSDGVLESRAAAPLLLHEMGHKMGLASDGSGELPDQQAHHYGSFDSHGRRHTGQHCSTGVAAGTDLWTDAALQAATCNMWGQLKPILSYCPECKTTLRKVDLSNGF